MDAIARFVEMVQSGEISEGVIRVRPETIEIDIDKYHGRRVQTRCAHGGKNSMISAAFARWDSLIDPLKKEKDDASD